MHKKEKLKRVTCVLSSFILEGCLVVGYKWAAQQTLRVNECWVLCTTLADHETIVHRGRYSFICRGRENILEVVVSQEGFQKLMLHPLIFRTNGIFQRLSGKNIEKSWKSGDPWLYSHSQCKLQDVRTWLLHSYSTGEASGAGNVKFSGIRHFSTVWRFVYTL